MRQFVTVDIAASTDRVWDVMSGLQWQEWTPTVKSIKRLDPGPFGIGSRVLIRQPGVPVLRDSMPQQIQFHGCLSILAY